MEFDQVIGRGGQRIEIRDRLGRRVVYDRLKRIPVPVRQPGNRFERLSVNQSVKRLFTLAADDIVDVGITKHFVRQGGRMHPADHDFRLG